MSEEVKQKKPMRFFGMVMLIVVILAVGVFLFFGQKLLVEGDNGAIEDLTIGRTTA